MSKFKFFMQELGNLIKSESTFGEFSRVIFGQKPKTLGEGLKRVKHSLKGVGEDLYPSKIGERTYKTSDNSLMNITTENVNVKTESTGLFDKQIDNMQAGSLLRVLRPSRNPADNKIYGVSRLRCLVPTYRSEKNGLMQETVDFVHKTGNDTKNTLKKVVQNPAQSTIKRMGIQDMNLRTSDVTLDRGYWNTAPWMQTNIKIKFPERQYPSQMWLQASRI